MKAEKKVKKNKNLENFPQSLARVNNQECLKNCKKSRRTKSVKYLDEIQCPKDSHRRLLKTIKCSNSSSAKPKKVKETASFMFDPKKLLKSKTEKQLKATKTATANLRKSKKSPSSPKKSPKEKHEFDCLKDLIEKTTPKFQSEKFKSAKPKTNEKTEKMMKKKSQKLTQKEPKKKDLKDSAEKPELSTNTVGNHKKSKSELIFPQKSKSEQITPQKSSPGSNKDNPPPTKELRISPPSRYTRKFQVSQPEKGTFLSSTLGKLSPGKRPDGKELSDKLQRLQLHSRLK